MAREMIVVSYDRVWPDLYKKEILESVFEKIILDMHHFGSTSIKILFPF